MEKRVAVYNNNTGVIETMSSLLAGEGLKMVAVTGRAQLQELPVSYTHLTLPTN